MALLASRSFLEASLWEPLLRSCVFISVATCHRRQGCRLRRPRPRHGACPCWSSTRRRSLLELPELCLRLRNGWSYSRLGCLGRCFAARCSVFMADALPLSFLSRLMLGRHWLLHWQMLRCQLFYGYFAAAVSPLTDAWPLLFFLWWMFCCQRRFSLRILCRRDHGPYGGYFAAMVV